MIKYSIRGENIEVTEAIREYVETKLSKVEKYFNEAQELDTRVKFVKIKLKLRKNIVKRFQQVKFSQQNLRLSQMKKQ